MADSRMVWCDCEFSGLDHKKERILEIGVAITDGNLENFVMGPAIIIHQPDTLLNKMDDWNKEHHGASGLIQSVKDSKITETQAEDAIIEFFKANGLEKGKAPLAGNSIYMDRLFIMKCLPRVSDYLHYRLIDVSTVKELGKRWCPDTMTKAPKKEDRHRAVDDIKDSIAELKFYKSVLFMSEVQQTTV